MRFENEEEALEHCFAQVLPSTLGVDEYNKLRQYKNRYAKGNLGDNAKNTILNRFGLYRHCYFTDQEKKEQ